jgi:hypothetical protein
MSTFDALQPHCAKPRNLKPSWPEVEALLAQEEKGDA